MEEKGAQSVTITNNRRAAGTKVDSPYNSRARLQKEKKKETEHTKHFVAWRSLHNSHIWQVSTLCLIETPN